MVKIERGDRVRFVGAKKVGEHEAWEARRHADSIVLGISRGGTTYVHCHLEGSPPHEVWSAQPDSIAHSTSRDAIERALSDVTAARKLLRELEFSAHTQATTHTESNIQRSVWEWSELDARGAVIAATNIIDFLENRARIERLQGN